MGMKPIMMQVDRHGPACSRSGSKLPMEAAVLIGNLLEQMLQMLTRLAGILLAFIYNMITAKTL